MTDYTERIGALLKVPVVAARVAGGQHGYRHLTATLADGRLAGRLIRIEHTLFDQVPGQGAVPDSRAL